MKQKFNKSMLLIAASSLTLAAEASSHGSTMSFSTTDLDRKNISEMSKLLVDPLIKNSLLESVDSLSCNVALNGEVIDTDSEMVARYHDSTTANGSSSTCYSNCYSNCHGSRSFR